MDTKILKLDAKIAFRMLACPTIAVLGLLAHSSLYASVPAAAQQWQFVIVEIEDLRADPEGGLQFGPLNTAFHDGSFDLFDPQQTASDALAAFVNSFGDVEGLRDFFPDDVEFGVGSFADWTRFVDSVDDLLDDRSFLIETIVSDPSETPFFSFFSRLYPGDDLFVGNDDPQRYRLFDENGTFIGPVVIDVYGADLLDAGVQENREEDLMFYDRSGFVEAEILERTEQEVVRPHPGFVGSVRSGEAQPGRLLSTEQTYCQPSVGPLPVEDEDACLTYDPAKLDFTQPGYPLFRIRVTATSRIIHGGWSGSYYDPDRSGEGFSIQFFGSEPDRVALYWFTYTDDDSGEQMWLVGQGEKVRVVPQSLRPFEEYAVTFYRTEGGQLTSTSNPDEVELEAWGTARLGISQSERPDVVPACQRLRLYDIQPLDDELDLELPTGENGLPAYELVRLGPLLSGAESLCANFTAYPDQDMPN